MKTFSTRKFFTGTAVLATVALALAFSVHVEVKTIYLNAKQHYVEAKQAETLSIKSEVDTAFREIYENLRTLSLLPSLRKIDRHASNLDDDSRGTFQQIYNNLAHSVEISEVYIVPVSFDPERLDPVTGKPEEPTIMFDELIVDAGRFAEEADPFSAIASAGVLDIEIPEYEMDEYRQLVEQLSWFKQKFPESNAINGLDLPMVSGSEVITCDNTVFVTTMRDADRSGIIFSVPFFGIDGKLKGVVSAIIRSNILRELLPSTNFALINAENNLILTASDSGQEIASYTAVSSGKPDSSLIYSEVLSLSTHDPQSTWLLWAGHPDSSFFDSPEARSVRLFQFSGYSIVLILFLSSLAFWAIFLHNMAAQRRANAILEERVVARTAEIQHMAMHDVLTGLPNRAMLHQRMEDALSRAHKGEKFAVLWIDLDHFKAVNDSLGHLIGDALLKCVSAKMLECVNEQDTVARVGGDEFVILQTNLKAPERSSNLAQRLIDCLVEPIMLDGHLVEIGASIGIAIELSGGEDAVTLLKNADIALYQAKLDGRATYRFFDPGMEAHVHNQGQLEAALRGALAADEFTVHYQPLIDVQSEKLTSFEALLRWNSPIHGNVSPTIFIPIAESLDLIGAIGEWVLQRACMDAATWPTHLRVAVNLSPVQFKSPDLGPMIMKALDLSGLSPARLELDITETAALATQESAINLLHDLRGKGVKIVLHNFGTGFSSLSDLGSFPFDKIKIDRSFLINCGESDRNHAIIKSIVAMGESLGMSVSAEGVETEHQLRIVRELGCTELQGFYFHHPLPLADVWKLLEVKGNLAA